MFRLRLAVSCVAALLLAAAATQGAPQGLPRLTTLNPGGTTALSEEVTVNVVFVGYEPGAGPQNINEAAYRAELAASGETQVRYPTFYGLNSPTHLGFNYNYRTVYASAAFENAFFGYLRRIGKGAPLTLAQDSYNEQVSRTRTIDGNMQIDAPSVERWLANDGAALAGVDTSKYTIYFINWFGRADFRHHVYTKTDEPDIDTGYNFGQERQSRKLIAWGGTPSDDPQGGPSAERRVWFYDLSAGPEDWTSNWDLDDLDVDGDDLPDYRMPPVWEYGNLGAYRPFDNLSSDLGVITRWVAVNLLFTTSPLYDPALSGPKLPARLQVDLHTYQGFPGVDARQYLNLDYITGKLHGLQPMNAFTAESKGLAFTGEAEAVYRSWLTSLGPNPVSYYPDRLGDPFGDLFLYACDHQAELLDGDEDYEVPVYIYSTSDDDIPPDGTLGYADDDWSTGLQSYIFAFTSPLIRDLGYGNSQTTIHEVGHHLGLSHPHDGLDPTSGYDYDAIGATYFTWSGDESNSVMNYLHLNDDFSQFDRDNMNRNLTSVYLNQGNAILAQIAASPRASRLRSLVRQADTNATSAKRQLRSHKYAPAVNRARAAYLQLRAGAEQLGLSIVPARHVVCPTGQSFSLQLERVDGHQHLP